MLSPAAAPLGAGVDERAAAEGRLGGQLAQQIEHAEDPLARILVARAIRSEIRCCRVSPRALQIGAHQLVLAAEGAVERGLGDAGPLDHPVDPDRVDPLLIEELVGARPAAARAPSPATCRRSTWLDYTRPVCLSSRQLDRPVCFNIEGEPMPMSTPATSPPCSPRHARPPSRAPRRPGVFRSSRQTGRVLPPGVDHRVLPGRLERPDAALRALPGRLGLLADHHHRRLRRSTRWPCWPRCWSSAASPITSAAARSCLRPPLLQAVTMAIFATAHGVGALIAGARRPGALDRRRRGRRRRRHARSRSRQGDARQRGRADARAPPPARSPRA